MTELSLAVCVYLVQHECIPQAVLGMDIICQAKSGMGKTAVFVLATLHQVRCCWLRDCTCGYSSV